MPKSILDKEVSCFASYHCPDNPRSVKLITWLTSKKYADKIAEIRSQPIKEIRDKLKAKLPAITPSGTFSYRSEKTLIEHSGFIQFDIDLKDNLHIGNYDGLKNHLCNIPVVAYCGLSASGRGYWGLIPIAYPEKHQAHFDALVRDFEYYSIILDVKPRSVASSRTYSYDVNGYFNFQAQVYQKIYRAVSRTRSTISHLSITHDQTADQVAKLVSLIAQRGIDITASYNSWFEIGCSLAKELGENGRDFFHLVSQFHPGYSEKKTNKQFDYCLKHNYKYQIGTFFYHCKLAGIVIEREKQVDTQKSPVRKLVQNGIILNEHGYPASWDL